MHSCQSLPLCRGNKPCNSRQCSGYPNPHTAAIGGQPRALKYARYALNALRYHAAALYGRSAP